MATRSKRTVDKKSMARIYCRKCEETKLSKEFYVSTDRFLDSNKKMSICKECCCKIFDDFLVTERSTNRAFLKVCRTLNVKFDNLLIDSVTQELEKAHSSGRKQANPFSLYMRRLSSIIAKALATVDGSVSDVDLTFYPPVKMELSKEDKENMSFDKFWGDHYSPKDVEYMEVEYAEYSANYDISSHSAKTLLKRLCKKQLDLKNADEGTGEKSAGNLEKELIKLMDTLAIAPNSTSAANANKMKSTFGLWIEEIERTEPAQWFEETDKIEKYTDVQKWGTYIENFITRPLKSYFSGVLNEKIIDEDGNKVDFGI